jgi:Tol biopolymer transport system component
MWSPDGRTISALADDGSGGSSGIVILDLDGTNPPIIVPATGNSGGTSWQRLAP